MSSSTCTLAQIDIPERDRHICTNVCTYNLWCYTIELGVLLEIQVWPNFLTSDDPIHYLYIATETFNTTRSLVCIVVCVWCVCVVCVCMCCVCASVRYWLLVNSSLVCWTFQTQQWVTRGNIQQKQLIALHLGLNAATSDKYYSRKHTSLHYISFEWISTIQQSTTMNTS